MQPKTRSVSRINEAVVPELLRSNPQWICWRAGKAKPNGKFDKFPVDPFAGHTHNAHDPNIWRSFDNACGLAAANGFSGVGYVLTGDPITHAEDSVPLYLIGIDIDSKSALMSDNCAEVKRLWLRLGKPYLEVSPSGNGFRMFALSRVKLKNGNREGNEMYFEKRFLTVTGVVGKGTLKDCTAGLHALHAEWFPDQPAAVPVNQPGTLDHLLQRPAPPETPVEVTKVRDMLSYLDADCAYPEWRDVVWSVEATGWACAERLGREWSQTAPHRFDEAGFQQTWRSFKPGGIGYGTLVHRAKGAGWVETITQPDTSATPPRFKLLRRAEFNALTPIQWLIRGVLPATGLAAIYGPSGSGKSFLALDALIAITEGRTWFNSKVKQAPVVYVALEGNAGIGQRLQAWEQRHGRPITDRFRLVLDQLALNVDADVEELADEIGKAGFISPVVVIDTLNQAAPEADENSSQDMGRIIKNAKRLQQFIGGLVVLVHHTGKDAGRGLRGHSSLLAALDGAIEVSRPSGSRQWTLAKSKDGADGVAQPFQLEVVLLGTDQDGEAISSCVVVPALAVPVVTRKKAPQGGHQGTALIILEGLLKKSSDFGQGTAPAHAPCLKEADAVTAVASGLVLRDQKRKGERAAAAIRGLIGRGLIACHDGWLWAT